MYHFARPLHCAFLMVLTMNSVFGEALCLLCGRSSGFRFCEGLALVRGVSKKFGEWYQKTNKTEDTNILTLLAFKIIAILYNTVGNVHKASGNRQHMPL
jgi:hypothetical protein